MPFTLVHPAAVLPLLRTPLVGSALVAGSVAPDLPYYVSLRWAGDLTLTRTHEVTSLLWLDPLLALALLAAWHLLLAGPLRALLPPRAAARVPAPSPWRPSAAAWAVPSVIAGAATHLAWDALGDVLGYGWSARLNLAGGLLGGAALVGWLARRWRTTVPRPVPASTALPDAQRSAVLTALALVAAASGAAAAVRLLPEVRQSHRDQGTESLAAVLDDQARIFAEHAVTGLVVAVAVYAVCWQAARRWRPSPVG